MSKQEFILWTLAATAVGYCGGRLVEASAKFLINKFCCNNKESIVNAASNQNVTYKEVSQNEDIERHQVIGQNNGAQPNPSLNYLDGLQKSRRGCWGQFASLFGY